MVKYRVVLWVIVALAFSMLINNNALADDGFGSHAAGGIELSKTSCISMESETLHITPDLIDVSFTFKNYTSEDISALVVFPLPDYDPDEEGGDWQPPDFTSFTVEVDGKKIEYDTEYKAYFMGTDCTETLEQAGVDVKDFNSYQYTIRNYDRLSEEHREFLEETGLVTILKESRNKYYVIPNWKVKTKYYWMQVFPANKTVRIKHSYTPNCGGGIGGYYPPPELIDPEGSKDDDENITAAYKEWRKAQKRPPGSYYYIDYILTSANTWRGPIKDFNLIAECDGCWITTNFYKITRIGPSLLAAHIQNFTPREELHVGFNE
jgi:Domain of unknown function (DUF4424)